MLGVLDSNSNQEMFENSSSSNGVLQVVLKRYKVLFTDTTVSDASVWDFKICIVVMPEL